MITYDLLYNTYQYALHILKYIDIGLTIENKHMPFSKQSFYHKL